MKATRKTMALIVLGSATLLGGITSTAAAKSDVSVWYSSSSHGSRHSSSAGILVIDGQRFTIRSYGSISRQIASAFRRCGYDASVEYDRVVVCFDPYYEPEVRWYKRGYRASIYRNHGRMSIKWNRDRHSWKSCRKSCCDGYRSGNAHHRGWKHKPRRRVTRRWCD